MNMKTKTKATYKILALALIALSANEASAKMFFEPHGAFIVSGSSDESGSQKYTGPMYGAKFGYYEKEFGLNYGVDITRTSYTYASDTVASTTFTRNDFGVFLGYNSQNYYRLWAAGYYTSTSYGSDSSLRGQTYEFGFGYKVSPKVSLNAYYRMPTFTKAKINGTSTDLNPKQANAEIALGVSFPLEL